MSQQPVNHAALLALLLPPSSMEPGGGLLGAQIGAEGAALDAVVRSGEKLLAESDPRTALEMLPDWERMVGLLDLPPTVQERQGAVVARLSGNGGQNATYYIALARSLGYDVTVSEYRPFRAGASFAGDELTNEAWVHWWMVHAPVTTVFEFMAGASCAGERVRSWGAEPLERLINKFKPAHTGVAFVYGI
jgi:uncharacterized protein YmfQ (DUF2313 family)